MAAYGISAGNLEKLQNELTQEGRICTTTAIKWESDNETMLAVQNFVDL
jgi:hypothetical protein